MNITEVSNSTGYYKIKLCQDSANSGIRTHTHAHEIIIFITRIKRKDGARKLGKAGGKKAAKLDAVPGFDQKL